MSFSKDSPERMDFEEGSDGDIVIAITRDVVITDESRWHAAEFNAYSITINVPNGGLIEIPEDQRQGYLYTAPADGYIENITIQSNKQERLNTGTRYRRDFYIKLKDGQVYGYVKVSSSPFYRENYGTAGLRLKLNLNSSRNLFFID